MSSSDRVRANAERLPCRRDMTSYDALSEEAFERLRGGAQAFNAWRLGNVETRLDFRKRVFSRGVEDAPSVFEPDPARLGGACPMGSRFMGANFREVQLSGADFRGAFLEHADFRGAHFEGARFEDARLGRTLFSP